MKKIAAAFYFLVIAFSVYSQTGTIQVTSVSQRSNGSGFVDIYFNLNGPGSIYNITVEVSFNGGGSFTTIPSNFLSGHVNGISPGSSKHIVWDGMGSFPNKYSVQTKLKLTANPGGNAPVAAFTATPTSGTAPLLVNFTDQSTNNPTSWLWEFGDGTTSTQQNPSKTYQNAGSYNVKLTATNAHGSNSHTKNSYITVTTGGGGGTGQPCPGSPTVSDIDGNVYNTVLIGNQCWMAENLNTTRDASGNNITRYCYSNNTTNCDLYGGLYTWATVMNGAGSSYNNPSGVQGICPTGWHVPSDAELTQLVDYVVAQGFPNSNVTNGAGNALKSCRQLNSPLGGACNTAVHPRWNSHSTHHGFDEFGFSAFPGGYRHSNGTFYIGNLGNWWSSTEYSSSNAWNRYMTSNNGNVGRNYYDKTIGFSVRCLRD